MDEQQQIIDLIKANAMLSTTVAQCESNINNIGNIMRDNHAALAEQLKEVERKADAVVTDLKIYKAIVYFIGFLMGGLSWLLVNFDSIRDLISPL